jgi:Coenzyme A transferase
MGGEEKMPVNKIYETCDRRVADIFDGSTITIGGFGSLGRLPIHVILALAKQGAKNLTVITTQGGVGFELSKRIKPDGYQDTGILVQNGQVKKFIGSVPALGGMPPISPLERLPNEGKIEIHMVPQGTLAERKVQALTEPNLIVNEDLKEIELKFFLSQIRSLQEGGQRWLVLNERKKEGESIRGDSERGNDHKVETNTGRKRESCNGFRGGWRVSRFRCLVFFRFHPRCHILCANGFSYGMGFFRVAPILDPENLSLRGT